MRVGGGDPFDGIEGYVRRRLADDPHVRATVLYGEVQALGCGYERSYQTFTRQIRLRGLRPVCAGCSHAGGRAHVDIDHRSGVELQWDWLELRSTPWGERAYVLVGVLSHSGRLRCWFSESADQAHLVVGLGEVLGRLAETARRWRVDRMATVVVPGTGRVQASFAPVAKHYGVAVDVCPPRRPRRKGVVERAIDYLSGRGGAPPVSARRRRRRHRRTAGVWRSPTLAYVQAPAGRAPSLRPLAPRRCWRCPRRRIR